jgi:prefoldin subunit 5
MSNEMIQRTMAEFDAKLRQIRQENAALRKASAILANGKNYTGDELSEALHNITSELHALKHDRKRS